MAGRRLLAAVACALLAAAAASSNRGHQEHLGPGGDDAARFAEGFPSMSSLKSTASAAAGGKMPSTSSLTGKPTSATAAAAGGSGTTPIQRDPSLLFNIDRKCVMCEFIMEKVDALLRADPFLHYVGAPTDYPWEEVGSVFGAVGTTAPVQRGRKLPVPPRPHAAAGGAPGGGSGNDVARAQLKGIANDGSPIVPPPPFRLSPQEVVDGKGAPMDAAGQEMHRRALAAMEALKASQAAIALPGANGGADTFEQGIRKLSTYAGGAGVQAADLQPGAGGPKRPVLFSPVDPNKNLIPAGPLSEQKPAASVAAAAAIKPAAFLELASVTGVEAASESESESESGESVMVPAYLTPEFYAVSGTAAGHDQQHHAAAGAGAHQHGVGRLHPAAHAAAAKHAAKARGAYFAGGDQQRDAAASSSSGERWGPLAAMLLEVESSADRASLGTGAEAGADAAAGVGAELARFRASLEDGLAGAATAGLHAVPGASAGDALDYATNNVMAVGTRVGSADPNDVADAIVQRVEAELPEFAILRAHEAMKRERQQREAVMAAAAANGILTANGGIAPVPMPSFAGAGGVLAASFGSGVDALAGLPRFAAAGAGAGGMRADSISAMTDGLVVGSAADDRLSAALANGEAAGAATAPAAAPAAAAASSASISAASMEVLSSASAATSALAAQLAALGDAAGQADASIRRVSEANSMFASGGGRGGRASLAASEAALRNELRRLSTPSSDVLQAAEALRFRARHASSIGNGMYPGGSLASGAGVDAEAEAAAAAGSAYDPRQLHAFRSSLLDIVRSSDGHAPATLQHTRFAAAAGSSPLLADAAAAASSSLEAATDFTAAARADDFVSAIDDVLAPITRGKGPKVVAASAAAAGGAKRASAAHEAMPAAHATAPVPGTPSYARPAAQQQHASAAAAAADAASGYMPRFSTATGAAQQQQQQRAALFAALQQQQAAAAAAEEAEAAAGSTFDDDFARQAEEAVRATISEDRQKLKLRLLAAKAAQQAAQARAAAAAAARRGAVPDAASFLEVGTRVTGKHRRGAAVDTGSAGAAAELHEAASAADAAADAALADAGETAATAAAAAAAASSSSSSSSSSFTEGGPSGSAKTLVAATALQSEVDEAMRETDHAEHESRDAADAHTLASAGVADPAATLAFHFRAEEERDGGAFAASSADASVGGALGDTGRFVQSAAVGGGGDAAAAFLPTRAGSAAPFDPVFSAAADDITSAESEAHAQSIADHARDSLASVTHAVVAQADALSRSREAAQAVRAAAAAAETAKVLATDAAAAAATARLDVASAAAAPAAAAAAAQPLAAAAGDLAEARFAASHADSEAHADEQAQAGAGEGAEGFPGAGLAKSVGGALLGGAKASLTGAMKGALGGSIGQLAGALLGIPPDTGVDGPLSGDLMVVTPKDPLELAAFAGFEQPKAVYAERGKLGDRERARRSYRISQQLRYQQLYHALMKSLEAVCRSELPQPMFQECRPMYAFAERIADWLMHGYYVDEICEKIRLCSPGFFDKEL